MKVMQIARYFGYGLLLVVILVEVRLCFVEILKGTVTNANVLFAVEVLWAGISVGLGFALVLFFMKIEESTKIEDKPVKKKEE
jgi:hypothetical protein